MTPDPWSDLLPETSSLTPFVPETMLRLIAYDIADPKRLRRVAEACADYGIRVQKSLFECWLEEARFEQLWERLQDEINVEKDALAAYVIDRSCAPRRRSSGRTMVLTHSRERFIL
ncbi:MAG: CRISPR-associated endonuclease Cas2 [Prosthecobacter sp.]|uniref:CRISPR-associated endonuclease Cas2 n=1 Tax=Prosthecobacter sp. TaxID=1965333 RepID=UPI003900AB5A